MGRSSFAVKDNLLSAIEPPSGSTECRLCHYTKCLCHSSLLNSKDQFYGGYDAAITKVPCAEQLFFCLGTSMLELELTVTQGPSTLDTLVLAK